MIEELVHAAFDVARTINKFGEASCRFRSTNAH